MPILTAFLVLGTTHAAPAQTALVPSFHPPSSHTNARNNARRYDWARQLLADAIQEAEPWANASDDDLWRIIVPPKLPRALRVNVNRGCTERGMAMYGERGPRPCNCGGGFGKLSTPSCRVRLPAWHLVFGKIQHRLRRITRIPHRWLR